MSAPAADPSAWSGGEGASDEEDPYAPRTFASYAASPSSSSGNSSSSSSSSSSSRSSSDTTASSAPSEPSFAAGNTSNTRASANVAAATAPAQVTDNDEEPAFGGRPFRDAHRAAGRSSAARRNATVRDEGEEAEQEVVEEEEFEELYALLNLPRDASDEAIREAWRSVAVILHPDKHTDPALKARAEARFRTVQRAYEILSDPEKRAVYDHLGQRGLEHSWALTAAGRGPADLQAELARAAAEKAQEDAEALVRSRGDFEARIDASTLFCHASRVPRRIGREGPLGFDERWNRVGCTQLTGRHSFEAQLTPASKANFAAQMVSQGGRGAGNLVGTLKTQWGPRLWTECSATALRPHIFTAKGQFDMNSLTFFGFTATQQSFISPPVLTGTYGQRLSAKSSLTGFTMFKTGNYCIGPWGTALPFMAREPPSISIGVTSQSAEGRGWTVQSNLALNNQGVSVDWGTRLGFLGGAKVRAGFNLGTASGLDMFTSAERRITEAIRIGVGLNAGLPLGGLTLKLSAKRLGQKLSVPITVSPEFRSDLLLAFLITPAVALIGLEHLYLRPAKRRRITERLRQLRAQNGELISERRTAAIEARQVILAGARQRARREWDRNGLVVVQAYYGKKEHFPECPTGDAERLYTQAWIEARADQEEEGGERRPVWDVLVPVQALVHRGQIVIPGGRPKSSLLGFFDPCMGERKSLLIRYLFKGELHEVIVNDVAQLTVPLRAHQL